MQDFSKMVSPQAAPTTNDKPTPEQQAQLDAAANALPSMEEMGKQGLPTGGSKEEMKQRLLSLLESVGALKLFKTAEQKQQLLKDMDALIEAYETQDTQGVMNNPITKLLERMQGDAPKPANFAGMMPSGGGMSGR